jgi:hypothetical protein
MRELILWKGGLARAGTAFLASGLFPRHPGTGLAVQVY